MSTLNAFLDAVEDHATRLLDAVRADRVNPLREAEWDSHTNPHTGREVRTRFEQSRVTDVLADGSWDRAWVLALRENPDQAERIDRLADAHRALIHAAGTARDRGNYTIDADAYSAHCIAFRGLAAFAPQSPVTRESLRDAIQELLYCSSDAPDNADRERTRQDALRMIRDADEALVSQEAKAAPIRIGSAQGEELEECRRVLRAAQDALWGEQKAANPKPSWDRNTKTLTWLGRVVHQYRRSGNQTVILDSFEAEGWPQEIVTPVTGKGDATSKERTREAVTEMTSQLKPLQFHRRNGGEWISWSIAQ